MEIREFAERILFGKSWEDKLAALDRFEDRHPGEPLETPRAPGRPSGLGLDEWHGRHRLRFREVSGLHSEEERGLVLHFFANHELLALELMALALLKFPEAPERFRRGVVQTLRDEQQHVRLYLERMGQVGIEFGQIPVSDFFWRAIAPMQSPMDFVAGLSLTLEQANLDYAVHYARAFRGLGDGRTAAILERVYSDEIGHVKHGLLWFNRWREGGKTEWDAYRETLRFPLSPGRAKGLGFNREGRLRAGLSEHFIGELEVFARSRGRCPAVYHFDPHCEEEVALGRPGFTPARLPRLLARDLETLPALLCARDDVVLVEQRPSAEFLRGLQAAGFALPEFVECGKEGLEGLEIVERPISALRPWGWSPDSARLFACLAGNLPEGAAAPLWSAAMAPLYSKAWSATFLRGFLQGRKEEWLCSAEVVGAACGSAAEVGEVVEELRARGWEEVVVKALFGSSGRNQMRLRGALRREQSGWLEKALAVQGAVVVEPWLDRAIDLSAQYEIEAGQSRFLGWTRFFVDGRGQYRGSFVSDRLAGLEVRARKFLYGEGRDPGRLQRLFEELGQALASAAQQRGYAGPMGVDALVCRQGEALRLKPVVEINPRFTMGRVALELGRRVHAARTALWLVLSGREVERAGYAGLSAFASLVQERHPVVMRADGQQMGGGALFTTEPDRARAFATLLLVGESLQRCREMVGELELGV